MENYHNWLLEEKTSLLKLVENTFLPKQAIPYDIKIFEEDFLRISLAFDSAAECHQDELRDSGEPYFTHPVSVARILLQQFQGVNINQILLALTHDTIESKPHFQEIINRKLGPKIVKNILAISKKDMTEYLDISNESEEYLYYAPEIFTQDIPRYAPEIILTEDDIGIVDKGRHLLKQSLKKRRDHDFFSSLGLLDYDELCVKIADRVDNLKTIHACSPDKQARTIQGTIMYFLPVAEIYCPDGYDLLIEALIQVTKEHNRIKIVSICNQGIIPNFSVKNV